MLSLFPALLDILPLQLVFSALVVPAFVSLSCCARSLDAGVLWGTTVSFI